MTTPYTTPGQVQLVAELPAGTAFLTNQSFIVTNDDGTGTTGVLNVGIRVWTGSAYTLATLRNTTSGGAGSVTLAGDVTGPSGSNVVVGLTGTTGTVAIHGTTLLWDTTVAGPTISQTAATAGNSGTGMFMSAQNGGPTGNTSGGTLTLSGGIPHGSGTSGRVDINRCTAGAGSIAAFQVTGTDFRWYTALSGPTVFLTLDEAGGLTLVSSGASTGYRINIAGASSNPLFNSTSIGWGTVAGAGADSFVGGQNSSTSAKGGDLYISGGASTGGRNGSVAFRAGTALVAEIGTLGTAGGRRFVALLDSGIHDATKAPAGNSYVYISEALSVPTSSPVGGAQLYVESGKVKGLTTSGVVCELSPKSLSKDMTSGGSQAVINDTTMADLVDFDVAVAAGERWVFKYILRWSCTNATQGIRVTMTFPTASVGEMHAFLTQTVPAGSVAAVAPLQVVQAGTSGAVMAFISTTTSTGYVELSGMFTFTSSGTVRPQFAQGSAAPATQTNVLSTSYMTAQRISHVASAS